MASINLSTILQVTPDTWKSDSYSSRNHVCVKIEKCSSEYIEVADEILRRGVYDSIEKIERVQHPFAYGRFLLRKEQLEDRYGAGSVSETRKLYTVSRANVKEAIQYNMDSRRTNIISGHYSVDSDSCIIITKRITSPYHSSNPRDSEAYPEYVVYFQ